VSRTIDAELVAFGICEGGEAGVIGQYGPAQPGQLVDELLVLAWGGLDIEVYPVLGEFGFRYYLEPDRWPVPVWVYQVGGTFSRSPVDVAERGAPEGTKQNTWMALAS
jgi:hypothetical protein